MTASEWHKLWTPALPPWEVALRATIIYFLTQLLLRILGRKELSRYATHDLVLIFLIATAVRESIVGGDSSLTAAAVGLTTIMVWDAVLSYASFRSELLASLIAGTPRRLIADGKIDEAEMRRARLSHEELKAQLRRHGCDDLGRVKDARLERSGQITFVLWGA